MCCDLARTAATADTAAVFDTLTACQTRAPKRAVEIATDCNNGPFNWAAKSKCYISKACTGGDIAASDTCCVEAEELRHHPDVPSNFATYYACTHGKNWLTFTEFGFCQVMPGYGVYAACYTTRLRC